MSSADATGPEEAGRLLLVGESDSAHLLALALEREGYRVLQAPDGASAMVRLTEVEPPDVVVLDVGSAETDGPHLCSMLRGAGFEGRLLVVAPHGSELGVVVTLDAGADDYVSKPYGLAEVMARLRALTRRYGADTAPARPTAAPPVLSPRERKVLEVLTTARGALVSRDELRARVWGVEWPGSAKAMDMTITRLRHKLRSAGSDDRVRAVRGFGFVLDRAC